MSIVISEYAKCSCGAYTIEVEDLRTGERKQVNYIGTLKSFAEEYGMVNNTIGSRLRWNKNSYANCNHCVNHWGLDLCGCGSGENFGKCKQCDGEYGVSQSLEKDFVSACDTNLGDRFKFR